MNKNENKTLDCDIVCDLLELYHDDIVRPATKKAVDRIKGSPQEKSCGDFLQDLA